jgi:hypothetical protein
LKIISSKNNYVASLDTLDRHKAASQELNLALKMTGAILAVLRLVSERQGDMPEFFKVKLIMGI